MSRETRYIYGLLDPQTYRFRYVGLSSSPLERLERHFIDLFHRDGAKGTEEKTEWLATLSEEGLRPYLVLLEQTSAAKAADREQVWISYLASEGNPLTNREIVGSLVGSPNAFGNLLLEIARKRGCATIGAMRRRIEERTGQVYKRQVISNYVSGRSNPKPMFNLAFFHAFSLTAQEAARYAWVSAFKEEPQEAVEPNMEMYEQTVEQCKESFDYTPFEWAGCNPPSASGPLADERR